jgi:hypothetical protein
MAISISDHQWSVCMSLGSLYDVPVDEFSWWTRLPPQIDNFDLDADTSASVHTDNAATSEVAASQSSSSCSRAYVHLAIKV